MDYHNYIFLLQTFCVDLKTIERANQWLVQGRFQSFGQGGARWQAKRAKIDREVPTINIQTYEHRADI